MGVIERRREAGSAPGEIVAAHVTDGTVDRTRRSCTWQQVAVYKGTGQHRRRRKFRLQIAVAGKAAGQAGSPGHSR